MRRGATIKALTILSGQRTDFHYNASGMLVGKSQGGARLEPWQWHGLGLVARGDQLYLNEDHATGSTGSPQAGGAALMSRTVGGKDEQFLMADYLGTTLGAIDGTGNHASVTEGTEIGRASFVRTSFGDGAAAPSGSERFTGKPYDADLGAHVFPYRNYRADIGRWMSADPINFPDGPSQHYYAPVPTMGVDPWGLEQQTQDIHFSWLTGSWKGQFRWDLSEDNEYASISKSPGFNGFTGVNMSVVIAGVTIGFKGETEITFDENNRWETETREDGTKWKRYVVDMTAYDHDVGVLFGLTYRVLIGSASVNEKGDWIQEL